MSMIVPKLVVIVVYVCILVQCVSAGPSVTNIIIPDPPISDVAILFTLKDSSAVREYNIHVCASNMYIYSH